MGSGTQAVFAILSVVAGLGFAAGYWIRGWMAERELSRGLLTGPRESVNIYKPVQEVPAIWK